MTIMTKAEDCPFCASSDQWVWEPGPGLKAIACSNKSCNATGPVADTVEAATAKWNTRCRRSGPK